MRVAYTNLVDDGTLTPLTEDLVYPIEAVQNQRLEKVYRSTAVTSQTIIVDLGSSMDVDAIAIIGHNITTGATISIDAEDGGGFTAPSFTTTLSASTGMVLKYLSSVETYRYWRYNINDATGGTSYIEIGRLWLGEYTTIDPSSLVDFTVTKHREDTVTIGRGRQKYATEGVGYRSFRLSFPRTATTALNVVQTMYDTVGNHQSFVFSNFDSVRDYTLVEPVYCHWDGDIDFRHTRSMYFTWSARFVEDR